MSKVFKVLINVLAYAYPVGGLVVLLLSFTSNAALKTDADDIKPIYIKVSNGAQLDAVAAVKAAISGERVLKCQEVEAKANSRSGNISLKKKQD
jgi:hypothetical protein